MLDCIISFDHVFGCWKLLNTAKIKHIRSKEHIPLQLELNVIATCPLGHFSFILVLS